MIEGPYERRRKAAVGRHGSNPSLSAWTVPAISLRRLIESIPLIFDSLLETPHMNLYYPQAFQIRLLRGMFQ